MAWDPTPWMIGGGAEHSTNVARNVSWAAFGGLEGIVSATDLEVRELAVPGTQVRVFPGTAAIQNRATGIKDEMYVGRLPSEDPIDIAPTDASSGRSDLIVARVENPYLPGESWADPTDPKVGPYIFTRVISNVPPTTTSVADLALGYSAIALARIDIPVSTGTITQDMITDLRHLAAPQRKSEFNIIAPPAANVLSANTQFHNWPLEMNLTTDVPEWATHAQVRAILGGVRAGGTGTNGGAGWNIYGELRVQFGPQVDGTFSQSTAFNFSNEGGWDRTTLMCGAPGLPLPSQYRGTSQPFRVEAFRNAASVGDIQVDTASMLSFEVTFINDTEANI